MIALSDVPSPGDAQGMDPKTCQSTGLWSIEGSGVDRTFRCTVCSRDFRRKEQLKLHFRTHTGERPHKCHICHSSFSRPGNLTAHMRTHTGERPFVCQVCHMRFSQSNNLKRHMKCHQQGENGEEFPSENSDSEQNRENVFTEIWNLTFWNDISRDGSVKNLWVYTKSVSQYRSKKVIAIGFIFYAESQKRTNHPLSILMSYFWSSMHSCIICD